MANAAIVDFDDTIFFIDACVKHASKELLRRMLEIAEVRKLPRPEKSKIYDLAFSKYAKYSKPNKMLIKKLKAMRNTKIIIMSARVISQPDSYDQAKYLLEQNKVPFDILMLRSKKAFWQKDQEWKLKQIKRLLSKFSKIALYEDKEENIEYIRNNLATDKLRFFLVRKGNITML